MQLTMSLNYWRVSVEKKLETLITIELQLLDKEIYQQIYQQMRYSSHLRWSSYTVKLRDCCQAMMSDCRQRTDPVPMDRGRGNFPDLIKR